MTTVVRAMLKFDCTGMDATAEIAFGGYGSIPYVIIGLIQTAIMSELKWM